MPPVARAHRGYEAALFASPREGGLWMRSDVAPFTPKSTAVGKTLEAIVNDGRWIVQCPECGSAQLVDPQFTKRFFCIESLNEWAGRQWVTVKFPSKPEAIEDVLEVRPSPQEMNWDPSETLEELKQENRDMGIVVPDRRPNEGGR